VSRRAVAPALRRPARRLRTLSRPTAAPGLGTTHRLVRHRRAAVACAALAAGCLAALAGGPVAAVAGALYGGLAVAAACGRWAARAADEAGTAALDAIGALAGDLRAGLAPAAALDAALPALSLSTVDAVRRLAQRVSCAFEVAEATGAPLADLLDRLESDARGLHLARTTAAAAAAGTRATAWLLAALPVAGLGLGYGMGADPVRILLHTAVGAGCAVLAMGLQVAGLFWSAALARTISAVA
jgi:tight adherence protein B